MIEKEKILAEINFESFYSRYIPTLKPGSKKNCHCIFHEDKKPSISIDLEKGVWFCHAGCGGGNIIDFYMKLQGVDFPTAVKEIAAEFGIVATTKKPKVVATFEYKDADGKVLYTKKRYEPARDGEGSKSFLFFHDKDGKEKTGRGGKPVLYNLPGVIKSDHIIFVEGEGKADLLNEWGYTATSLDSGAGSTWCNEYTELLKGKEEVIIFSDNDKPGKSFASRVASELYGNVKVLKVVGLLGLKEGEDIVDWERIKGNDKDALFDVIKTAPEWTPEKEIDDFLLNLESWTYIQGLDIKVEWLVDRIIPKGSITVIFGKGGIGKTWLVMGIARCIGSGIPFMGLDTIKSPVIYIDFENPLAVLNERTLKLGDAENVHFWRGSNENMKPPKLDSSDWKLLMKAPKGSVLIFDTLRAAQGRDENASDEMSNIMGKLKVLRDMGYTIILIHHTAKNSEKAPKGSTAIVDLADHILGLTVVKQRQNGEDVVLENDLDDDDAVFRFGHVQKTRFEPYHIYLTLNPDRGFEIAPDPQEEILKEMHGVLLKHEELNKTEFVKKCNAEGLGGQKKLGKLVGLGTGRYWIVDKGEHNKHTIKPKNQFGSSANLYSDAKLPNYNDTNKNKGESNHEETNTEH